MTEQAIRTYGATKGFHKQTLDRWLSLSESDRRALLNLVQGLKMGENHLKDFLDWLGEVAIRDGQSFAEILSHRELSEILSDPRPGRSDKLKCLKDELRRLRFPRLAKIEEEIQRRIRKMTLDPQILVTVPPGLETGTITVRVKATDYEEMKRLIRDLTRISEGEQMKEIFALLRGEG